MITLYSWEPITGTDVPDTSSPAAPYVVRVPSLHDEECYCARFGGPCRYHPECRCGTATQARTTIVHKPYCGTELRGSCNCGAVSRDA